ncbi:hypothetical protein E5720_21475 [Rhodococcus sp. PAMC28707]|uniref:hypothetical protein n=1 Tax=unclassified Rhodococcus (in: high G+C Gram-positive bacteria) TaxID=192944 RepID=UPI00109DA18E|nr:MULTISPECIES: hypothetical protein [unclassified Rhodococcus (in: high G+C Gram-positive bacteria)]QCB51179.1 hypothetical protein E5769_14050 [Rhodococcus sp. PAMC28705]QCB60651.1 hypothetical protein E5720_21475 [Rhodococcus sp. PAMC28707]
MRPIGVTYPPLANLCADFIYRIRQFSNVLDIKNRSFSVTGSTETPSDGSIECVIIARGGGFGGWALYIKNGHASLVCNLLE